MIGYTPSSPRAPRANVDITINNGTGTQVNMNKGTIFTTSVDGQQYQFVNNDAITIQPQDNVYKFSNVVLYEGSLVTFKYTVDVNDPDQKFIIPSPNADTTTLKVSVQNSSTDTSTSTYTLASDFSSLEATSKVFFIQETNDNKFEVYFGDGVLGSKLADGNIVILEYIVTNKEESNGANSFSLSGNIGGFTDVSITVNSSAQGGAEAETNESIKFNAPLSYAAQNRAVTTSDYESFVRSIYPNALSVSAWGGEDDEIPVYGVVKISINPISGSSLTTATKNDIVTQLNKFNVASVRPEIVDPETTSIVLNTTVKFNENATIKNATSLRTDVINAITNYNTTTLQRFDGVFRYSKLIGVIDNVDSSIVSNITTIKMRKTFEPLLSTSSRYDIYFRNGIYNPHSGHNAAGGGVVSSTGFKVSGSDNEMFLDDDGNGNVRRYHMASGVKVYDNETQGTVNYTTGHITLNSLTITSVSNIRGVAATKPEITVIPVSNDVVPVRNNIIEIDTANSTYIVESDAFVGGSADAGVGYTTTTSY